MCMCVLMCAEALRRLGIFLSQTLFYKGSPLTDPRAHQFHPAQQLTQRSLAPVSEVLGLQVAHAPQIFHEFWGSELWPS